MPNYVGLRVLITTRSGLALGCAGNVTVTAVSAHFVRLTDGKRSYTLPRESVARVTLFR